MERGEPGRLPLLLRVRQIRTWHLHCTNLPYSERHIPDIESARCIFSVTEVCGVFLFLRLFSVFKSSLNCLRKLGAQLINSFVFQR